MRCDVLKSRPALCSPQVHIFVGWGGGLSTNFLTPRASSRISFHCNNEFQIPQNNPPQNLESGKTEQIFIMFSQPPEVKLSCPPCGMLVEGRAELLSSEST